MRHLYIVIFGHPMDGGAGARSKEQGAEDRGQNGRGQNGRGQNGRGQTGREIGDRRWEIGALTSLGECRQPRKGITAKDTKSAKDAKKRR